MNLEEVRQAADQAWIGFWNTCMADTGVAPVLPFDAALVARVLNMPPPAGATPSAGPAPVARPKPARRRPGTGSVTDEPRHDLPGHEYYLREGLLDQLDRYFVHIERMKKQDPETYRFYSRVGAMLLPDGAWSNREDAFNLSPFWKQTRPAFGAVAMLYGKDDAKGTTPRFITFRRYSKRPGFAQPAGSGDFYLTNVFWDILADEKHARKSAVFQYCTHISADGQLRTLKMRTSEYQVIHHKHARNGKYGGTPGGSSHTITHSKWSYPEYLLTWARHHNKDPDAFLREFFLLAAHWHEQLNLSSARVLVTKDRVSAAFGIDILRTPYFFRDRDVTITDKGSKRRIFHIVRSHMRGDSVIRTHFRGERDFAWNGYKVKINVPGLHHTTLADVDIGVLDPDTLKPGQAAGMIEGEAIDDAFASNVHGTPFGDAFGPLLRKPPGLLTNPPE